MDLKGFQEELGQICNIVCSNKDKKDSSGECTKFGETLEKFLKNETVNFEEKVSGLTAVLNSYSKIRPSFEQWDIPMNSLGHSIFMECARVILGMDLPHYKDDEEPKASFCTAIKDIFNALKTYAVGQSFIVLQFLLANNWGHPVLVAMMNGDDVEEEKALAYLSSGEYPELFKLRIEMLLENGCDALAQNLCSWCVRSPVFSKDLYVWRTNLVLLQKLDKEDEFVNQCMDVSCCLAVQILDHWSESTDEVIKAAHLGLSQSSLLQYWVQSEKECCTRPLLRHWAAAQEHENEDNAELQNSLQKLLQLAKLPETICTLVQVVMEQFGERYQEFCSMALVQCLRRGRQLLDSAKIKRDMREAEYAADGLARACRMLAVLYEEHPQMCLGSLLTAFYLEPERDLYREISTTIKSYRIAPSVKPVAPGGIDPELYHDVYELVQFLRPNTFALNSSWRDLRKLLIGHMEEAGFVYLPRKNSFKKTEEAPPTVVREKKQKVNTKKKWKPVKFVDSGKSKEADFKTEEASTAATDDLSLNVSSTVSTSSVASTLSSTMAVTSANLSYSCATYTDSPSHAPRITDQIGVCSMNNSTPQQWPTTTSASSMIHSSTSMSYQQPLSILTGLANTMSDHSYSSPNSHANSLKEHSVAAPLQNSVPAPLPNTVPTPLLKHNSSSMTAQQSMIVHSGTIPRTATTPQVMQKLPGTQVSASLVKHPQLVKPAYVQKPVVPTQLNQLTQKPVTSTNSQLHSSHAFQGQPSTNSQHQLVNSHGNQLEQPVLSSTSLGASKTGCTTVTVRQQLDLQNAVKKLQMSKIQMNQGNQQRTQQAGACTLQPTTSLLAGSGQTNILINPAQTGTSLTYLTPGGTNQAFSTDGVNTLLVGGNPQQQVATNIASYVMPGTLAGQSTLDVANIGLQIPQAYVNQSSVVSQSSQFSTLSVPSQQMQQNTSISIGTSSNAYSAVPSSSENTIQQIANQVRQMGTLPVLSLDEVQQVLDCNTPTITSPPKSKTDVNAIKQIQYFLQSDNLPSPISTARIAPLKRNTSSNSPTSQPGKSFVPGNLYSVSQSNQGYSHSLSTGAAQSVLKNQSATVLPHVHDNTVTASTGKRVQYALQQREVILPGDVQPVGSSSKPAAAPQKAAQTMTMKYLDENNQVKSTTVLTKPAGTSFVQIAPCRTPAVQQVVQVAQVPQVTAQVGIPQPVKIQVQTQPQLQMQSFIAGQVLPPVSQQYVVQGSATPQFQQQIVNTGALQAAVQVPGSQQLCTQQSLLPAPPASSATTQSSRPNILSNKSSKEQGKGQRVTPILPAGSKGLSQQQQQNQLEIPTAIPQSHQTFSYASPVNLPLNQNLLDFQLSLETQMSLPTSVSTWANNLSGEVSADQNQSQKLPTPVDCVNQFIDQVMNDAQLPQSIASSAQNIAASVAPAAATTTPVMKSENPQAPKAAPPTQQIENVQPSSAASSLSDFTKIPYGVEDEKSRRGKSPKRTFTSPEKICQLLDSVVERVSTGELAVSARADDWEDDDLTLDEEEMIFGKECHADSLSPDKMYTSDAKLDELLSDVVERLSLGALEPNYEELLKSRLRVADLKLTKEEKELIFCVEKTEDDQTSKVYTTPQQLDNLLEAVRKASRLSLTSWSSDQVAELFNSVVERVSSVDTNPQNVSAKDAMASSEATVPSPQKAKEEVSKGFGDSEKPESTNESSSEEEEEVEVEVIVGPYFCKFCQAGFGTMAQRRRHQEWMCSRKTESEINPEDFKILSCDFCGRELNTMSGLKQHYSRYHPELKHLVQLPSQPPSTATSKQRNSSSACLGSREAKTEDQAQPLDRDTRKKSQWYGEYSSDDSFSEVDTDEEEPIPKEPIPKDATSEKVSDESKDVACGESGPKGLVNRFSGEDTDQPYLPSIEDSESASTELYEATSMDSEPASPAKLSQRWRRCKSRVIMDSDDSLSTSSSDEDDHYATRNAFRARSKSQDHEQMKKCFVRLRRLSATEVNAYTFGDEEKYANCLCAFCGDMFSGLQKLQSHLQEHLATSLSQKGETSLTSGINRPKDPASLVTSVMAQKCSPAGTMPNKQFGDVSGRPVFNHPTEKDASINLPEQKKITFGNVDMYETRTRFCEGCGAKFKDISEFPAHMERCSYSPQYTETTQYRCTLCTSVAYKTMEACRHHVLFGCSGNPERKQPLQKSKDKAFSWRMAATKPFGCGLCDSSFFTIDLLQNHAKSVHPASLAHFSASRKKKKGQLKNTQKQSDIACQTSKWSNDQEQNRNGTAPVKDEISTTIIKDANSLPGSNTTVGKDAANQSVLPKNTMSLFDPKRIVCRYKDVQMYEVRCYKCKICYQEFTSISAFRDHCGETCNEPAQILWVNQCYFCDETFDQKSDCLKHMELVCQKATEQKTENVKQNELFCPFCKKSFYVKWVLQQHLLKAHHRSASEAIQISQKLFDGMSLDATTTDASATKPGDHDEHKQVQETVLATKDATSAEDNKQHSKQDVGHPNDSPAPHNERNELHEDPGSESKKAINIEEQDIPPKWDARLRKTRAIRRTGPLVLPSARSTKAVKERTDTVSVPTLAELVSCTFLKHCSKKWEESNLQHFQCIYCGEEQRGLGGFHWHLVYSHASEYVASKEKRFRHNPLVDAPVVGSDNESGIEDDVIFFKKTEERDSDAVNKRWTLRNHEQQSNSTMLHDEPEDEKPNIQEANQKKRKHSGDSMKNKAVSKPGNHSNEEELLREHVENATCQTGRRSLRKRQAISYEETYTNQDFAMSPAKYAGSSRVSSKPVRRDIDAQTSQNKFMDQLLEKSSATLQGDTSTVNSCNQGLNDKTRGGPWSRAPKKWVPGNRKPATSSQSWKGYMRKGRLGKKKFRCLKSPLGRMMVDKSGKNLQDVQVIAELLPEENENGSTVKSDSKLPQPKLVSTPLKTQLSKEKRTARVKRDQGSLNRLTPQQKKRILTAKQAVLTNQRRRRKRKDVEGHREIHNGDVDGATGSNSFLGQVELVYTHIGTVADGIFDLSDLQGTDQLGFLSDGSSEVSVEKSFHHDLSCNEPSDEAVPLSQDVQVDATCNALQLQCQTGTGVISDSDEQEHSGWQQKNLTTVADEGTKNGLEDDNPVEKDKPSKNSSPGSQKVLVESSLNTSEEVESVTLQKDDKFDQERLSGDVPYLVDGSNAAEETNFCVQQNDSSSREDAEMKQPESSEMTSPGVITEGSQPCKNSSEASDSEYASLKVCLTANAGDAPPVEPEVSTLENETHEANCSDRLDGGELASVGSTTMETDGTSTTQLLDDNLDEDISSNSDMKNCSAATASVKDDTVSDKMDSASDFTSSLKGDALESHQTTVDSAEQFEACEPSTSPIEMTASNAVEQRAGVPAVATDTEEKVQPNEQCAVEQDPPVAAGSDYKSIPSSQESNTLENTGNQKVGSTSTDSVTINQADNNTEQVNSGPLREGVPANQQDHQEEESKAVETVLKDVCMSKSEAVDVDGVENVSCNQNSEDDSLEKTTESSSLSVNQSNEMSCATRDDQEGGTTDDCCATDKESVKPQTSEILDSQKCSVRSEVQTISITSAEKDKILPFEFLSTSQEETQPSTYSSEGRLVCCDNKLSTRRDDDNPADSASSEEKETRDDEKEDRPPKKQELSIQVPEESTASACVESPPVKESKTEEDISSTVLVQQGKSERQKHKHHCDHCGNSFLEKSILECHLRWVHHIDDSIGTVEVKKLKCPICRSRQEFDRSADLQCHMKWVHCISMFSWAEAAVAEDDKVQVPRVQVVSPTECDVEEESTVAPFQHQADPIQRPEDLNAAAEADSISLPNITLQETTTTTNTREEDMCSTTSADGSPATDKSPKGTKKSHHKSAKTSLKSLTYPWMCFFCEERFIKRFQLAEHMKKLHAPDPKFQLKINKIDDELYQEALFRPAKQHRWRCAPCRVAFPSVGEWTKHMKDIHGHSNFTSTPDEAELFVDSRGREPSCPFIPLTGSERTSTVITVKTKPVSTTEPKWEAEKQTESSQQKLEMPSVQRQVTDCTVHSKESDTTFGDQHGPSRKKPLNQAETQSHKSDAKGLPWMEKMLLKDYSRVHKLHAAAKRKLVGVKLASKKGKVSSSSRGMVPSKDVSSNVVKDSIMVPASHENHIPKDSCDKSTLSVPMTTEPQITSSSCSPKSTESQTVVEHGHREHPPMCVVKTSSPTVATKLKKTSTESNQVTVQASPERAEPDNNCDEKILRQSSRKRKQHVQHASTGKEPPAAKVAKPCQSQKVASKAVSRKKETVAPTCSKTETETVLRLTRRRTLPVEMPVRATRSRSCSIEPKPISRTDKTAKKVTQKSNTNLDKAKSSKKPVPVSLKSKGVIQTRSGRVTQQHVLVMNVLKKAQKPTISKQTLAAKKSTPDIKRNCNKTRSLRSNSSVT